MDLDLFLIMENLTIAEYTPVTGKLCPFKQYHNTSMEAQEGEEVLLLLIHDLDTRYG
jgi:hypothetical protein